MYVFWLPLELTWRRCGLSDMSPRSQNTAAPNTTSVIRQTETRLIGTLKLKQLRLQPFRHVSFRKNAVEVTAGSGIVVRLGF